MDGLDVTRLDEINKSVGARSTEKRPRVDPGDTPALRGP